MDLHYISGWQLLMLLGWQKLIDTWRGVIHLVKGLEFKRLRKGILPSYGMLTSLISYYCIFLGNANSLSKYLIFLSQLQWVLFLFKYFLFIFKSLHLALLILLHQLFDFALHSFFPNLTVLCIHLSLVISPLNLASQLLYLFIFHFD